MTLNDDAPQRTPGWGWCAAIAAFSIYVAFSQPLALIGGAVAAAYGYHLYNGGRDFTGEMADGRRRQRAWIVWALAAVVLIPTGVQWAPALLAGLASAAYAAYLWSGGRDMTREASDGSGRSIAWLFYAVITGVLLVLGFSHAMAVAVAAVTAIYSLYLFFGGRWVLWIW